MVISIKSEMDSRPLLYPLIKSLLPYGSLCVISSNRSVSRLYDDNLSVENNGFKNITLIVRDSDCTADEIYEEYGINTEDFDYIIVDNMAVIEYDLVLVALGSYHTLEFDEDIKLMRLEYNVRFFQFGKPIKGKKTKEKQKTKVDVDTPEKKFSLSSEEEALKSLSERVFTATFPTWEDIDKLESTHVFYTVPNDLATGIYEVFKDKLAVDKMNFTKRLNVVEAENAYFNYITSTI